MTGKASKVKVVFDARKIWLLFGVDTGLVNGLE